MIEIIERFREWEYEQERVLYVYERRLKKHVKYWRQATVQRLSFVGFLAFRAIAVIYQIARFTLRLSVSLFLVGPTLVKRVAPNVEEEVSLGSQSTRAPQLYSNS